MRFRKLTSSRDWVAYFTANAAVAAAKNSPRPSLDLLLPVRTAITQSLPAQQLGQISSRNHLRAAAGQYSLKTDNPEFRTAVEFFVREEQSHGSALAEWLDLIGIPRKSRNNRESLFRAYQHMIPSYALWVSVRVMAESMAEIYYAAIRRSGTPPLLKVLCEQILRDEIQKIRCQCEHLAVERRRVPSWLRRGLFLGEMVFYGAVCQAVWLSHGRLLNISGLPWKAFVAEARARFAVLERLLEPERYLFPKEWRDTPLLPAKISPMN